MATPQELATEAYENLEKQAAAQQKLNDAGKVFLAQFGPVADADLRRLAESMGILRAQLEEKSTSEAEAKKAEQAKATAQAGEMAKQKGEKEKSERVGIYSDVQKSIADAKSGKATPRPEPQKIVASAGRQDPRAALANQAVESLRQQAAEQQKLNDAGAVFLAQFGPVAPRDLRLVTQQMRQLQVQGLQRTQQDAAKAKAALVGVPVGIAASVAALTRFSHAANPQLVGALGTQIELLQAKLGNRLLPVFSRLMSGVEDFTDWFDGLSGGMQNLIAGGIVAVPVVLTVAKAVSALAPAARVTISAVKQLHESLAKRLGGGAGLAMGGLGVAAAGATAFFALQQGAQAGREDYQNLSGQINNSRVSEQELERGGLSREQRQRLMGGGAEADEERARMRATAARLRREVNGFSARFGQSVGFGTQDYNLARAETLDRLANATESVGQRGERVESNEEMAWRKRVGQLHRQSAAASREMAPHYSGLSDIHKQMQTAMLAKNPYEQKLLEEQRKSRKILEQMLNQEMKHGREKGFRVSGAVD